jgi:flagellar basal body-associated protein FliL
MGIILDNLSWLIIFLICLIIALGALFIWFFSMSNNVTWPSLKGKTEDESTDINEQPEDGNNQH